MSSRIILQITTDVISIAAQEKRDCNTLAIEHGLILAIYGNYKHEMYKYTVGNMVVVAEMRVGVFVTLT